MARIDTAEVLSVFDRQDRPSTPLTAPEVADAIGCARTTANKKLTRLADRGDLATKKVGARGRVWWRPTDRGTAGHGGAGTDRTDHRLERRAHERSLRELHVATRRLIGAEDHETVCGIAVGAVQRVIGLSLSGLWLYAPDRDVLEPVAWTESGVAEYGEPPAFPVEGSLVGRAFREGDHRVYDDVTVEEPLYDPDTSVRSELILPLGEHGVLNASSPEVGAFDDVDVSLGRILSASVRTALDRAVRLEERRARRRELERQRDELEALNQLNALIEATIGALVGAATREEIERTVCDRLAGSGFYVDAWIAERRSSTDGLVLRTVGRGDGGDVDSPIEPGWPLPGPNPIESVVDGHGAAVIPRIDDEAAVPDRLRSVVRARGTRSCLAVPLAHLDTVFGVLVVHAPDPEAFSDRERTGFETLGRVVGFVINATNNRRLLLGNTAVEIEFGLADGAAWFVDAADRLDGTVSIEGIVTKDDGGLIEYVTVDGAASGDVPGDIGDRPSVERVRDLGRDGGRWFLECLVREPDAGLRAIAEYGATVRRARADGGRASVVTRFPGRTPPREAMDVIRGAFPGAELAAKRVVDTAGRSVTTIRQAVRDRLTAKQLAALRAAYLAGYYETPRRTTARDLADSLDIAPSTLHQHLQAAQRKVLATVFAGLGRD